MKNVLIVDDSATQRVILKAIVLNFFKENNIECTVTESSDGGQALIELGKLSYDCVFTDINMEPVSGIDLLEQYGSTDESVTFVFISSHLSDAMKKRAEELGGDFYITKPLLQEKVEPVLKDVFK